MAKREWKVFSLMAGGGFLITSLAVNTIFNNPHSAERILPSFLELTWPYFPGFAASSVLLFAALRPSIIKQGPFILCLLKCCLLAMLLSLLTPIWPTLAMMAASNRPITNDLEFLQITSVMGFVFGLPSSLVLGTCLALALHKKTGGVYENE